MFPYKEKKLKIMEKFNTPQESFWAGEFGDDYINRNMSPELLASNIYFFSNILRNTLPINSILEFGANIGLNLKVLKALLPNAESSAVEINKKAVDILKNNVNQGNVYHQSILDFKIDYQRDFVFTKGVLIHLNPDELDKVYTILFESSKKYICVAEYYNPSPVSISYRGHEGYLFKRDFAGELMDKYPSLRLVDYGFAYRRDNNFKQDDITWFLISK